MSNNREFDNPLPPILLVIAVAVFAIAVSYVTSYKEYIHSVYAQQDRELLREVYSRVLDCRQDAAKSSFIRDLDRICGEVPTYPGPA